MLFFSSVSQEQSLTVAQSTLRLGNAIKRGRRISTSSSTRELASSSIRTNCFINPDNHYMHAQLCSVWTSTPSQTKTLSLSSSIQSRIPCLAARQKQTTSELPPSTGNCPTQQNSDLRSPEYRAQTLIDPAAPRRCRTFASTATISLTLQSQPSRIAPTICLV